MKPRGVSFLAHCAKWFEILQSILEDRSGTYDGKKKT